VLSIPLVNDIEALPLAVCSDIKVILPCAICPGVVMLDIELLLCLTNIIDTPYILIMPSSMLPDHFKSYSITAEVVLKYPAE
jgi:hypothetical protein